MIDRYTTPEMADVWSEGAKYATWAKVEAAAAEAQGAPRNVIEELNDEKARPGIDDIEREEAVTRHDVVAFVQAWRRYLTDEAGGWLHRNMTSSDLVDSAIGLRLDRSFWVIDEAAGDLIAELARHGLRHKGTVRVGRTHGQHAELTTWGLRVAGFAHNLNRARRRLLDARSGFALGKLSGPVGDWKRITPDQEREFLLALRLSSTPVATQVVPRDGIADFVWACAQIATALEETALEIRLCQRSEVGELAEGFAPGQRGSSAMPHKRNPITAERLCGLARLIRAQVGPVLEGVAMHHERDISHSSVERVALVDVATLTHFALVDALAMWRNLVVVPERMTNHARHAANVTLSASITSRLIASGVGADQAWQLVHDGAQNPHGNLVEEVKLLVRRKLGEETAATIDWKPLFKESMTPLLNRTGDTGHVFDDLIELT